ncbi:hypothetical protein BLOT_010873 [Blomia tropicalis]|nr:hypothetical protein BLOT_010873 [Blomia tropicalis]
MVIIVQGFKTATIVDHDRTGSTPIERPKAVTTGPGLIELTRIPFGPNSRAEVLVIISTAALDEL